MTPEIANVIQGYSFLALLVILTFINLRCCIRVKAWLWAHHRYHERLGLALCRIEEYLANPANGYDDSNRICPPGGGGDGYGEDPPPEL